MREVLQVREVLISYQMNGRMITFSDFINFKYQSSTGAHNDIRLWEMFLNNTLMKLYILCVYVCTYVRIIEGLHNYSL